MVQRSKKKDAVFFAELAKGITVTKSAEKAGYSRRTVYLFRKRDPVFAELWQDAKDGAIESFEEEADRRALKGFDEPVFFRGEECGKKRVYSDALLMFRLKALAPERYRDRQEVRHDGTLNVNQVIRKIID